VLNKTQNIPMIFMGWRERVNCDMPKLPDGSESQCQREKSITGGNGTVKADCHGISDPEDNY
jgi:hypothetical protein